MGGLNQQPIEIDHEGQTIWGTFSTWAGLITVNTERGTKTAEIDGTSPTALARVLLRELARDGKA